jgi:hypothetical protein
MPPKKENRRACNAAARQDSLSHEPANSQKSLTPQAARIPVARLRHLARLIHALGPRPLFELLRQLDGGAELHPTLEAYARLPANFIAAYGGDRLMPPRAVDGGQP